MTDGKMIEKLGELLDDFEHECFMIRVEALETGAKDGAARMAYERRRDETAQAVAATLGSGKLTAEQVADAVLENFEEAHETRYDHWEPSKFDWQAIADELNALLGSGTYERPTDSEGVRICIADTVHMLRSEHGGDHEWEDVVIELAYCEYGGDKWIVRGARGEARACDCTVTGHDEKLYEKSGDWENLPTPWDMPEPDGWHECPDCGCVVGYTELYGGGWSIMLDDYQIPFNACPNCGKAVKQ